VNSDWEAEMSMIEFEAILNADDSLDVPREVAVRLPRDRRIQVTLRYAEPTEITDSNESDWDRVTQDQFLSGDAPGDAIYDSL
jgi:hypothetical protein